MKKLILILAMSVFGVLSFAQPANDEPCNAITVNPQNCDPVTNQSNLNTVNNSLFTVTCDGMDGSNSNTVWYNFTSHDNLYGVEINFTNTTFPAGTNISVLVLQNFDCVGLTANGVGGNTEYCGSPNVPIQLTGDFLPNVVYTIQVTTLTANAGDFDICFQQLLPPPGCADNNNCDLNALYPPLDLGVLDGQNCDSMGCNTGATNGFAFGGCDFSDEPTVWYTFTTGPEDAIVHINFHSEDITNPHIGVFFYNDCSTTSNSDQCEEVTDGSGNADFYFNCATNHTYTVAVSGDNQENGDFIICFEGLNDNTVCNTDATLTVTNTSEGSPPEGPFCPGEVVSFRYLIDGYDQVNCNWLHAVIPTFGNGWNPASFNADGSPVNSSAPPAQLNQNGNWDWYPPYSVNYNVTNVILGYQPNDPIEQGGWFFTAPSGPYPNPTGPDQTWGDGNSCNSHVGAIWTFTFDLIVGDDICTAGNDLDISMIAFGDGEAGAWTSLACTFEAPLTYTAIPNCNNLEMDPIADQQLCPEDVFDIALSLPGDPAATFTWTVSNVGPHITGAADGSGNSITQDLANSGLYPETVTYTVYAESDLACNIDPVTFIVTVNPVPSTDFTAETPICIDNSSTVQYTGTLVGNDQIQWFLDGGTTVPAHPENNPNDPFEVSWSTPGPHEIFLMVNGDYCTSFSDFVEITVLPNDVVVDITEDDMTICDDAGASPIQLHVSVTNNDGTGSGVWSGTGVSAGGLFTPANANAGPNVITYTYTEHDCTNSDQITITLIPPPTATFTATSPICQDNFSVVTYTGNASGSATLNWDFDGGTVASGTGTAADPYHIVWNSGGTKTISLTVAEGTCSNSSTQTVQVDPSLGISINPIDPNPFCLDASTTPIQLTLSYTDGADGSGTAVWSGPGISTSGLFTPTAPGTFQIHCDYSQGLCSASADYTIIINQTPTSTFDVSDNLICTDEEITVTYTGNAGAGATYDWNWGGGVATGSGQGPYTVSWATGGDKTIVLTVTENGCTSSIFSQTVTVEEPIVPSLITCADQTPTSVTFYWDPVPGITSYIVTGSPGTLTGTSYAVTGLSPNDQVTITVEFVGDGVCPNPTASGTCTAISCPDFGITFDNPPGDICLDGSQTTTDLEVTVTNTTTNGTETWSGPGITDTAAGIFDPDVAGPGTHTINFTYEEGSCSASSSFMVTVLEQPDAAFSMESPVCVLSPSTIYYSGSSSSSFDYTWDFDGGTIQSGSGTLADPFEVFWTTAGSYDVVLSIDNNGCTNQITQQVIVEPPIVLSGSCTATTNSVTYTWTDIGPVTINVTTGPTGTLTGNTYTVTGMNPGDLSAITITGVNGNACGNPTLDLTCQAMDCPPVTVTIDEPIPDFCLDGTATPRILTVTVTGDDDNTGSGAFEAATGLNTATGEFDPVAAGAGSHVLTYTYTDEGCTFSDDVTVVVNNPPPSDFTFDTPICITDYSTIAIVDLPDLEYNYEWNYDGGVSVPGTGPGPNQVTWATAGTKTVTLTVTDSGCSSTTSHEVVVEEPEVLTVVCGNSTLSSVTFDWNAITGATGYSVTIDGGAPVTVTGNTYTVNGLDAGDNVNIVVEAIVSGPCDPPQGTITCTSQDCPDITVLIDETNTEFCLDSAPFTYTVTVTGDDMNEGSGHFLPYTGLDVATGTFTPSVAGAGTHTLTYQYDLNDCTYTDDVTIIVNSDPPSDFSYTDEICLDGTSTITFAGTQNPDYIYTWDFDGGVATPATGPGPLSVGWTTPGTKTVSLTVDYHGCTSTTSHTIEVVPPQVLNITCSSNTNTITFSWNSIAGASDYTVTIDAGAPFTQTETSYTVTGLVPGDMATISVVASLATPCEQPNATLTCEAKECPPVVVVIDEPVPDFCLNSAVSSYRLTATVTGDTSGTGSGVWLPYTGLDVTTGTFDPTLAGAGTHTLTYVYTADDCDFTDDITITVYAPPTNEFTVVSPVCVDNPTTLTYSGNVNGGMSFAWNVGTGTPAPDATAGPHNVQWADAGIQNVTLVVTENGCAGDPFDAMVEVMAPLEAPVITCNEQGLDYVEFIWNNVPGADTYTVTILAPTGASGVSTGTNTFRIDGLVEGQIAQIQVEASGTNVCGSSFGTGECEARSCDPLDITINAVPDMCYSTNLQPVNLIADFHGHTPTGTGTWSENGAEINLGIYDPVLAGVGNHIIDFRYVEEGCAYTAQTTISIYDTPIADAGPDATITCENAEITLGSDNSTSGAGITYNWTATNGVFPGDPDILHPVVNTTGDYILTVTNEHACSSQDRVIISGGQDTPVPGITTNDISCFGDSDGYINVDTVIGGVGPYLYSHNGETFQTGSLFSSLGAGTHTIQVMDANGCQSELINLTIIEPEEVDVELIAQFEDDNIINFGDSLLLIAETVPPPDELDTIIWEPNSSIICDSSIDTTCTNVWAFPIEHTVFTVTVGKNGCFDTDKLEIFVKKERPVYVPNSISPSSVTANNNRITVFANAKQVEIINDFMIFNRWGEKMYEVHHIPPNDPTFGWDGTYHGKVLNPAVFVYYVEVEFKDGSTEIFKGDITLIK